MTTERPNAFYRSARLRGRALVFFAVGCLCGCFAGPEPLPPTEALERAHERITSLIREEREQLPDAIVIESPEAPRDASSITVWYPSHPVLAPVLGRPAARAEFELAHPGVKLEARFIGEWHVAIQKLTVALAGGDLPDIALVERSWAARLAQAGRIMPLDGFLAAEVLGDIHPHARDACTMQGRIWALPADGFCSVLYYNRDLVANPPETWTDVRTFDRIEPANHEELGLPVEPENGVPGVYAGFLPPLQGSGVGASDPGAAARFQRALPRAILVRPYRGSGPHGTANHETSGTPVHNENRVDRRGRRSLAGQIFETVNTSIVDREDECRALVPRWRGWSGEGRTGGGMLAVSRFAVASGGDENSVPCNGPYRCEDRLTQGQARHFSNGILEAEYIIGYLPFLEMLWSAGGRLCELNRSGLDAPPATRTLEFLTGLHDTNQTHARMLGNPVYAFASFLKGEVAMTAGPSEWLPQTRDASFPVGLAPLPGENGPVSRLGDMVLVVFAKHAPAKREGIIAVLDFLTGPAVQGAEAARLGSMPVRQSLAESAELSPGLREAYAAALAPPFTGVWSAAEFELLNHLGVAYRWLDEKGQAKPLP